MLTDEFRKKLIELMRTDPKAAIAEIEKDPKLLELLLNNTEELRRAQDQLNNERSDKIKYVNMTNAMQAELSQKATELRTSQGLLIGAGIILLLSLLSKKG